MKLTFYLPIAILLTSLLLTACGGATPPAVEVDAMMTAGINTMVASFFGTQTAVAASAVVKSTSTLEPLPPTAVFTLSSASPSPFPSSTAVLYYPSPTLGTLTPFATGTQSTATINPNSLAFGCNNLAFIRDVTAPGGTVVRAGESFTKTWKVINNGTCNWLYQYSLEFLSANYPEGGTIKLGRVVTVNNWAELSIALDAPKNPGTYTSYWRMSDGAGHMFGATLIASYVVGQPTNTPEPPTMTPSSTPSLTPSPTPTFTDTPSATSTTP